MFMLALLISLTFLSPLSHLSFTSLLPLSHLSLTSLLPNSRCLDAPLTSVCGLQTQRR